MQQMSIMSANVAERLGSYKKKKKTKHNRYRVGELGLTSEVWDEMALEAQTMVICIDAFPSAHARDNALRDIIANHGLKDNDEQTLLMKVNINIYCINIVL